MVDLPLTPFHDWLVHLRRRLHEIPELAYREYKTGSAVAEVLTQLGVPFHKNVAGTGIVAVLDSKNPGPTLALRADMDALPITERTNVSYRSKHRGVMHACGHDGHMAMLLGTARWLLESNWQETGDGRIWFIFQPAEEGGAGAYAMLESGLFAKEEIEGIFAFHMQPELAVGHVGIAPNVSNAASRTIRITLTGKGGHGAHPHLCVDPIVAGASLITQLQSIVSRNVSPLESVVLSLGRFESGTACNIIPEQALIEGTLRTLSEELGDAVAARITKMVEGAERAYGVSADLVISPGYPLLINDSRLAKYCMDQAADLLGAGRVHTELPRMGAEDFAYFLQKYPGAMMRLGCRLPEATDYYGLHSPYFDFDERALDVGVRLYVKLLTRFGDLKH